MKKRPKNEFKDDGRTIANMNVDGMPWYDSSLPHDPTASPPSGREKQPPVKLTKKERRALMRAAYGFALKIALFFVGCFFVAMLLLRLLWAH